MLGVAGVIKAIAVVWQAEGVELVRWCFGAVSEVSFENMMMQVEFESCIIVKGPLVMSFVDRAFIRCQCQPPAAEPFPSTYLTQRSRSAGLYNLLADDQKIFARYVQVDVKVASRA